MKVGSKVSLHPVDPDRDRTPKHGRDEDPRFSPLKACHDPAIHLPARGPCLPPEVTSQFLGPTVQPDGSPFCSVTGGRFKTLPLSTEACHGC